MVEKPEVLAIIPARGGSKGIPGKNIKNFVGYPLIVYSIAAAQQSAYVTRVVVSTDSPAISDVALKYRAEVPFLRPKFLAEDNTLDLPVMVHCLEWLLVNENYQPDVVVWLRPTSPIRPRGCVDDAIRLLLDHPEADSVRGVVPAGQNPFKMWFLDKKMGKMDPILTLEGIEEAYNAPRQRLPDVYWQTGHIDAIRTKTITEKGSVTGDTIFPLIIDPKYTVDIDIPQDWQAAEQKLFNQDLNLVLPGQKQRRFPEKVECLLLDFDGVLTDDRVWVNERGEEMVAASRADGLGLEKLRNKGIPVMVISRETNPVVAHRCKKLKLPVLQAVLNKDQAVRELLETRNFNPANVIYIGNDVNDLVVFPLVGYSIVPADAHPEVKSQADLILIHTGGNGAVREVCDMILSRLGESD